MVESWLGGGMNDGQYRTRTVNARTRGFLSDGRKEDDGADKSAANLTRPPFCLVIESWLGVWLLDGLPYRRMVLLQRLDDTVVALMPWNLW